MFFVPMGRRHIDPASKRNVVMRIGQREQCMTDHHRADVWPRPRPTGKRKAHSNSITSEIAQVVDLDGLTSHLGYLIRRTQIWVFQDFIRTLASVDIRPAQYSVLTVIDANPGLTQVALSNALGIERARLVHLLNGLEVSLVRGAAPVQKRSTFARIAPHGQRTECSRGHQSTCAGARAAFR